MNTNQVKIACVARTVTAGTTNGAGVAAFSRAHNSFAISSVMPGIAGKLLCSTESSAFAPDADPSAKPNAYTAKSAIYGAHSQYNFGRPTATPTNVGQIAKAAGQASSMFFPLVAKCKCESSHRSSLGRDAHIGAVPMSVESNRAVFPQTSQPVPHEPFIDRRNRFIVRLIEGLARQVKGAISKYLFCTFCHVAIVARAGRWFHSYFPVGFVMTESSLFFAQNNQT